MVSKIYISNIYLFQIHSMAKKNFEGPDLWSFWKGQNVQNLWPLVQVSKNSSVYQWHTWALGPWILFIQNGEIAPEGVGPPGKQPAPATGVRPPYVAANGYDLSVFVRYYPTVLSPYIISRSLISLLSLFPISITIIVP